MCALIRNQKNSSVASFNTKPILEDHNTVCGVCVGITLWWNFCHIHMYKYMYICVYNESKVLGFFT